MLFAIYKNIYEHLGAHMNLKLSPALTVLKDRPVDKFIEKALRRSVILSSWSVFLAWNLT